VAEACDESDYPESCYTDCHMKCEGEWNACSYNRETCNQSFQGSCSVEWRTTYYRDDPDSHWQIYYDHIWTYGATNDIVCNAVAR